MNSGAPLEVRHKEVLTPAEIDAIWRAWELTDESSASIAARANIRPEALLFLAEYYGWESVVGTTRMTWSDEVGSHCGVSLESWKPRLGPPQTLWPDRLNAGTLGLG